jgi:uncharacterized membrane protein
MDRRTTALALGIATVGVAFVAGRRRKPDVTADRAHSTRAVTIRAGAAELYTQWTAPEHLAEFHRGVDVEVAQTPGKRYEWRTVDRAPFAGGGSLTFLPAPADRGTEVRLALFLEGPAAKTHAAFARIFGAAPAQIAMESLRAFKSLAETGEVAKADRQ